MNDKLSVEMLEKIITHSNVSMITEPFKHYDEYTVIDKDGHLVAEYENQIDAYLCVICPPSSIKSMASEILELREQVAELERRLDVPVKLPHKNLGWDRDSDDCWNNAIDACELNIRDAGFQVKEG